MQKNAKQFTDILALAFWLFLAGLRLGQAWQQRSLLALMLMLQAGLVAYALTTRRRDVAQVSGCHKLIASLSALLPFLLQIDHHPSFVQVGIAVGGLALSAVSLINLGKSFGIAPADRGLIRHGPYYYLRHPVYAGELLSLFAIVVGKLSPWNVLVFALLLLTVIKRIQWEEHTLSGYPDYSRQVPWRLIPGLW